MPSDRFTDPRFRILDVEWRDSRGACWARAEIMKLWDHEKWFLQLDSHHRFVQDWDAKLFDQMAATGSPKPILTTYAGPFTPGDANSFTPEPMRMEFDRFTEDGIVLFRPGAIPEWQENTAPVHSRFLSAHFFFAPASFVSEVPYDPGLYFIGEEITLTVRAFTHGYDLFHPGEVILWHEYTRNYRPKHWDDHTTGLGVDVDWTQRDAPSRESSRRLLTQPHTGAFGCGIERSVADYEAFAGISFVHRRAQDYTRRHLEPPNPPVSDDWIAQTRDQTVRITIAASQLHPSVHEKSQFWYVGIHDGEGRELLRADADREEIERILGGGSDSITVVREFQSTANPASWSIRPCTTSEGWLDPIEGGLVGTGGALWESEPAMAVAADHEPVEAPTAPRQNDLTLRYPEVVPGLRWSETEGGFIVTQVGHTSQYVVNSTGVLVLELANGRYSMAEIIDVVGDAFGLSNLPRTEVTTFLDSVSRCGLVEMHERPERNRDE